LKLLYLEKSLNCFIYWLKARESFKRDEILDKVWGNEVVVGGRTIDVHIRKLREKLEELFKTIKGVGYKFEV
jgi:two-component system alkaline phosphatase synthesis response regulator PhoP